MSALTDVIELQVIIFLIMLVGLILTRRKIITPEGRKCLTDLLIDVILPCNIICSFMIEMNTQILKSTLIVLGIALGIQIVCYLLGKVIYWFAPQSQKMVLQYATMCSNAGFMGNPIIEGIYGAEGLLYASIYLIPLRFFMWSAGLFCFKKTCSASVHHSCMDWFCINVYAISSSTGSYKNSKILKQLYASCFHAGDRFYPGGN